jgi:hypothetical protein
MAHLHFQRTVYKSGGGKATARIESMTRQPDHSAYVQQERSIVHEVLAVLMDEHTRNLPAWAEGNPHTYFRAAERYDRHAPAVLAQSHCLRYLRYSQVPGRGYEAWIWKAQAPVHEETARPTPAGL